MLKLLAITLLTSSLAYASNSAKDVKNFLTKTFKNNPAIENIEIKVTNEVPLKEHKNWTAYYVELSAVVKKGKRKVSQKMVWFTDGDVIAKDLFDINKAIDLKESVALKFKDEYYSKANLIYGDENARHKVVIFSDPLCPFCQRFVPSALEYMKKDPQKFAVYYFHFPLPNLHPASVELVKAATALEFKGGKDVALRIYKIKVNPREKSQEKILKAFNKAMGSNITLKEMNDTKVLKHLKHDLDVADDMMVNGTPTMFFDGKKDKSKNKYKTAK
jgi:protein-disulfide isomerase